MKVGKLVLSVAIGCLVVVCIEAAILHLELTARQSAVQPAIARAIAAAPKPEGLVSRADLFSTALFCGGLYALCLVLLKVFYPFFAGVVWQHMIGPVLAKQWPSLVQSADRGRPSYLPTAPGQPFVVSFGLFPAPLHDVTMGIRDGFLLGVGAAVMPDVVTPWVFTAILAVTMAKHAWRVSNAEGAVAVDRVIYAGKEVLMYAFAILALRSVDLLH
ncbi:hypothetical protein WS63_07855 [Burkholderia stagnalis]|uniref:hypothetical protein n=1 Tax=Burkholderia stagnalis TaxID=1503054 RepID=UPI00075930EB|nr:hypothetical protein [Burkholderia stagnalis]KVD92940.1 hypothetical protein WS63_07855 [Burkholderia stagnalis]